MLFPNVIYQYYRSIFSPYIITQCYYQMLLPNVITQYYLPILLPNITTQSSCLTPLLYHLPRITVRLKYRLYHPVFMPSSLHQPRHYYVSLISLPIFDPRTSTSDIYIYPSPILPYIPYPMIIYIY
jgi:hypothetical protein